ncbi:50S ribosomal protein L3 N(5)-glutamine methyltransferase [Mesosutterella sp. OilRF-GAM-744-9]|uniref:50S ribosomal protein L3 N(5)-glutamine methyltransferase n=1 Tax=Mesosutterella porci TaxID=2915351 RepID=A0ABS9MQQ4_9BURK|nr:50S ribosomal protein L3 N(5)-glutamine methyltransferase [Mesosutterella sp. oilRF-744-WT-GAM-9]MCG5030951.1 50S ribosomal protein L3 N(5)-glutamine methyltransferase [Mesosutterella sp. oilRF-744-WT-GAM-9]
MPQNSIEAASSLHTIRDLVRWAMTRMEDSRISLGHGTNDTWEEATFLVLRALKLPFDKLDAFFDANLTEEEVRRIACLIEERVTEHVPVPYLLHEAWLVGHRFYCDENVLIPRSFIAELLEEHLQPWVQDPLEIGSALDMCTGSGCLAVLLAEAFSNARVTGVDISPSALEVARVNRSDYGLEDRMELVLSDLFDMPELKSRRWDLIISNPPYVTTASMESLPDEYRHEPTLALEAGGDGMDVVRRLLPEASRHLTNNGLLVVEVGDGREALEAIWPDLPLTWLTVSAGDNLVFLATARDLREYFGPHEATA